MHTIYWIIYKLKNWLRDIHLHQQPERVRALGDNVLQPKNEESMNKRNLPTGYHMHWREMGYKYDRNENENKKQEKNQSRDRKTKPKTELLRD